MDVEFVVGFTVVLLVITLLAEPLARVLRLPHSSLLIVLGALVAYFVTLGLGIDTGLRAASFHDLIFFVFLPVLIFEAAFNIPATLLTRDLGVILFLAIAGMLLTTLLSAAMIYVGIGHPTGFPWIAALITGALLAATDPVAVVAALKTLGAPERLGVLLEGESLFNDATAIVVFTLFLTLAQMPASELSPVNASIDFLVTFLGGAVIGLVVAGMGIGIMRMNREKYTAAIVTLAAAYGSFLIAEAVFHVSGVMGSLAAGLVLARAMQSGHETTGQAAESAADKLGFLWGTLSYLANGSVFLLMGITITIAMFTERWLAMLIAIVAVLTARTIVVYGGLSVFNRMISNPVPTDYQTVMIWGGLRGAVTLALALSLPVELEYWWTIQSMAFGVVLFTLMLQAPTMKGLLHRKHLDSPTDMPS